MAEQEKQGQGTEREFDTGLPAEDTGGGYGQETGREYGGDTGAGTGGGDISGTPGEMDTGQGSWPESEGTEEKSGL
jgi:hypothetical protein